MGYLEGFGVTFRKLFKGTQTGRTVTVPYVKDSGPKREKPERIHGRHVLNRYEDGMEKCIGCELCAGVCPARCIYVRGKDNPPDAPDDVKALKPDRLHGRHVLNRYEDGMEKCIGCELCAGVCPAKCIYVRGKDNDPDAPTSPGERFGFVYEINYLRCIHCDLCVEACPTEAITESKPVSYTHLTLPTNREV